MQTIPRVDKPSSGMNYQPQPPQRTLAVQNTNIVSRHTDLLSRNRQGKLIGMQHKWIFATCSDLAHQLRIVLFWIYYKPLCRIKDKEIFSQANIVATWLQPIQFKWRYR